MAGIPPNGGGRRGFGCAPALASGRAARIRLSAVQFLERPFTPRYEVLPRRIIGRRAPPPEVVREIPSGPVGAAKRRCRVAVRVDTGRPQPVPHMADGVGAQLPENQRCGRQEPPWLAHGA